MLEKIGTDEYKSLSRPRYTTIENIKKLLSNNADPIVAEIGIGIGATSQGICQILAGRGELHIFDFQTNVDELHKDFADLGHSNVFKHGNSGKYWDSYHWSLIKLLQAVGSGYFDYIYLDGAHTVIHDTAAFFISDKLLKVGGTMDFDGYDWSFARSRSMKSVREKYMTPEQEAAKQVKLVIDTFVNGNPRYEVIVPNRTYRKLANG